MILWESWENSIFFQNNDSSGADNCLRIWAWVAQPFSPGRKGRPGNVWNIGALKTNHEDMVNLMRTSMDFGWQNMSTRWDQSKFHSKLKNLGMSSKSNCLQAADALHMIHISPSLWIVMFSNLWNPQVTLPQGNAPFHSSVGSCSNSPQSFSSNEPSNAFNMSIHFPSHFNFLDVKQPKAQQTIEINRLITKDHATGSPLGSLEQGLPEGLPLSWTFLSGWALVQVASWDLISAELASWGLASWGNGRWDGMAWNYNMAFGGESNWATCFMVIQHK